MSTALLEKTTELKDLVLEDLPPADVAAQPVTDPQPKKSPWSILAKTEDWWTVWLGFILIIVAAAGLVSRPTLPLRWGPGREGAETILGAIPIDILPGMLFTAVLLLGLFSLAVFFVQRDQIRKFLIAFPAIFLLAVLAEVGGNYAPWRHYGFNNVIWALGLGMLISNLFGTPAFLKGAVRTELYIKTGLVLLGASILFNRVLVLGGLGLGVAWIVTPIVLIAMYWFSQKVLKMRDQKQFAMAISAATSVCGVSAAIATGAASKAKKEEVSLAISMSLIFTALMMIGMPMLVNLLNIDPIMGGAWLGGTIDATGAVAAAGAMLGEEALEVAALVKMIQNILVGVVAFGAALYFATRVEKRAPGESSVGAIEIWNRLPKFVIGFVVASLVFSFVLPNHAVEATLPIVDGFREFFFTLAFISIGLECNFKSMAQTARGGKGLTLYVVGQSFNIVLTLFAAWIFFSGRFFALPF